MVFFGKPSCGGNARQRARLRASGHEVDERDLFTARWTAAELLTFLDDLAPADWFNPSAVRVKSGEIRPASFGRAEAMSLLLADPRLIRRPLLEVAGQRFAGWDEARLHALIGLDGRGAPVTEACAHPSACDPDQAPA
ncbi:MAG: hypothetical protein AB1592_13570 [Pseudomonadota bacterium]